jgi:hypothetical protein
MCSSFYSSNHNSCLLPSFPFHPRASTFAATAAVHVHIKPHPCHATAATFDKAPSEPAANAHHQRTPSPPDTTTHTAHIPPHFRSFHHLSHLASPCHTPHHTVPHHAAPRHERTVPLTPFNDSSPLFCSSLVCHLTQFPFTPFMFHSPLFCSSITCPWIV